jgi:hypothetical protein
MTNSFNDAPREKSIFNLSLPEGSQCIALTTLEKVCLCAAFEVPDRGIEIYVLNPNTGKCVKVENLE